MIVKGLNLPRRSFGAPLVVRVEPVGGSVEGLRGSLRAEKPGF